MTVPKRRKNRVNNTLDDNGFSEDEQCLAQLDQKICAALFNVYKKSVDPRLILHVVAQNMMEFGLWASNGAAPVAAALILNGMADRLKKFDKDAPPDNSARSMEVEILSDWPAEPDSSGNTREFLLAVENHLCKLIAMSLEGTHTSNKTVHSIQKIRGASYD